MLLVCTRMYRMLLTAYVTRMLLVVLVWSISQDRYVRHFSRNSSKLVVNEVAERSLPVKA